jgi:AcrR family transcriptional regulator
MDACQLESNTVERIYFSCMLNAPSPSPKPDGRRARGDRTRQTVLGRAIPIAATEGLDGLTFGRVAQAAGVPKSTLQVLFKDRETLQLQTLSAAADAFAQGIRERLPAGGSAFERLKALCDAWFELVAGGALPGGCLVTATAAEYRARPGTILALAAEHQTRWRAALLAAAREAQRESALDPDLDLDQLLFEVLAFQAAANLKAGQVGAVELQRARRGVNALLERARHKDEISRTRNHRARPP